MLNASLCVLWCIGTHLHSSDQSTVTVIWSFQSQIQQNMWHLLPEHGLFPKVNRDFTGMNTEIFVQCHSFSWELEQLTRLISCFHHSWFELTPKKYMLHLHSYVTQWVLLYPFPLKTKARCRCMWVGFVFSGKMALYKCLFVCFLSVKMQIWN